MIPAPPDPVLGPQLARALDGDAAAAFLGVRLRDVDILACRPVYARWKPATSCVVQYRLLLSDAAGRRRETTAHARLYADGRALRLADRPSLAHVAALAERWNGEAPSERAFPVPELGALVQLHPVDRNLPSLGRVSSPATLGRLLGLASEPRLELVRYKPGRKALLRVESVEAGVLYAKVYADAAQRRVALARAIADRGVPTPRPALLPADDSLAVQPAARGARLEDLAGPDRESGLRAAADTLARLHAVEPPAYTPPDDDLDRVRTAGQAVAALVPGLAAESGRLAAEVRSRLGERAGAGAVLLHGDFYDDQVLVGTNGATLLDLDEARRGQPLSDVGTMAAHLSADGAEAARDAFLEAFGAAERAVAPHEAAALLRLAAGPFRRLEPEWEAAVERLVRLARVRLGPAAAPRREPRRVEIPEPAVVAAELAAVGRTDVEIETAEIVRHKPGRRCTLRYGARVGGRPVFLYGKVYASDRAARVFETYRRLHVARVRIGAELPAPVACVPLLRFLALSAVAGAPAGPPLAAGDLRVAGALAETLHRFHRSEVVLERVHTLAAELAPLPDRVERLAKAQPSLASDARRCLALARAGARRPWRWRSLPILRDVYEEHVLLAREGLALLDLDDAAMSEPAVDVANVVAHLRLLSLRGTASRGARASAVAVAARYGKLDAELDRDLVRFLVGTTLLRLAGIHGERERGAELGRRLLEESRRALRRAPAAAARRRSSPRRRTAS